MILPIRTGNQACYDSNGAMCDCKGTGQDGEFQLGYGSGQLRFVRDGSGQILDRWTGLAWFPEACPLTFPLDWQQSFDAIADINRQKRFDADDWRMPNRRELRSLIWYGSRQPALPPDHPFTGVFLGWYWTSTTAAIAPAYAWHVHLAGGRMFYGRKDSEAMLWPVRGASPVLAATGEIGCSDYLGREIPCAGTGQDGAFRHGISWPKPRFACLQTEQVLDRLTGLIWHRQAIHGPDPSDWQEALDTAAAMASSSGLPWRLPNINELESLVDACRHAPALPDGHPFAAVGDGYWSSTTSAFATDWAHVLYLDKGAVGVGYKRHRDFSTWPVRSLLAGDSLPR